MIITYRSNAAKAEATLATLDGDGHWAVQASVTDSAEMTQLATQVTEKYGRLDLLVNNAGITTPVPHDDLDGPQR